MQLSEEELKKNVVDQLYWDSRVDASKIKVEVKDSEITLRGEVPNYNVKGSASADAWAIEGVTAVNNLIQVKYPVSVTVPTDEEIKSSIETSLQLNWNIDSSDIEISVVGGIATLEGSVDTYWKKLKVEDITSQVSGVLDVINKLTIVPTENFIDKEIAEDIIGAISRNFKVNAEHVDVKVENGEVVLSGTVADWSVYRAVMDATELTAGVTEINDNLIIERL
ncbi:MAG: Transport-associated protein [Promethearchaeota archaeon]|nr:MAG: Transport-associated protein [Candidatus Lokiarchaeota archaeon]